jgi:hypothetical protein
VVSGFSRTDYTSRAMMRLLTAALLILASGLSIGQVAANQATDTSANPRMWVGRHAEFEDCLKNAVVERSEQVPIGVTKPTKLIFKAGGICSAALFSSQFASRESGYLESHDHRIAAYEVDKLLGLDMVPPTVSRSATGRRGSAQLWIDGVVVYNTLKGSSPDQDSWTRQVRRWRVFDNLIAEIDRNAGNILVLRDPAWSLVLVDHSRAFTNTTRMVFEMERIDRPFLEKLKALDRTTLDARVGKLVLDGSRSILRRRDAIVAHFEKLAKAKGESAVITP